MRGRQCRRGVDVRTGAFHGALSPVGSAIGVLLVAAPLVFRVTDAWVTVVVVAAGPVLGVLLLAVPGPARHLGTGLVVSLLTYPLALLVLLLLSTAS